jgi:hypothetical protein
LDPELLPPPELELEVLPPELEPDDVPLDPPDDDPDPDPLPEDPPEEPPLPELDPVFPLSLVPQACAPRNAATAKIGGTTQSIRIPILSSVIPREMRHAPSTRMPKKQARPHPARGVTPGPHLP